MTSLVRAWRQIAAWFAPARVDPVSQPPSFGPYRDAALTPPSQSLQKANDPNTIVERAIITGGRARPGDGVERLE